MLQAETDTFPTPGYHLKPIRKGKIGESSKISEEVEELLDAEQQGNKIMMLCELSDLYGAIEAYLLRNFPGIDMKDLRIMAQATSRAFKSGHRK